MDQGSRSMKRIFAIVVLSFLVSTVAFAQKINVDWDRQANFSQYHTYMSVSYTHLTLPTILRV